MSFLVKPIVRILGIVLLIVGIAGFFTGSHIAGIEVDMVHNIVHIATGLIAIGAAGTYGKARLYLIVFGLVYAVVAVVGVSQGGNILGLFHTNDSGNYLHAAIGLGSLVIGFGSKKAV